LQPHERGGCDPGIHLRHGQKHSPSKLDSKRAFQWQQTWRANPLWGLGIRARPHPAPKAFSGVLQVSGNQVVFAGEMFVKSHFCHTTVGNDFVHPNNAVALGVKQACCCLKDTFTRFGFHRSIVQTCLPTLGFACTRITSGQGEKWKLELSVRVVLDRRWQRI
jgi:hypothetical protein